MATARDIVTRALKRLAVLDPTESVAGADASDGLAALNDLIHEWKVYNVDVLHSNFAISDTVAFFVPPRPVWAAHVETAEGRIAQSLRNLASQGNWDASANSPTLASATGTQGHAYKVTTAGSTTLDLVTSWAVNDYALFDGASWLKSQPVDPFIGGLVAMLAVRLADDYGREVKPKTLLDAEKGWQNLLSYFIVPDQPTFDRGLSWMPSQRYVGYYTT